MHNNYCTQYRLAAGSGPSLVYGNQPLGLPTNERFNPTLIRGERINSVRDIATIRTLDRCEATLRCQVRHFAFHAGRCTRNANETVCYFAEERFASFWHGPPDKTTAVKLPSHGEKPRSLETIRYHMTGWKTAPGTVVRVIETPFWEDLNLALRRNRTHLHSLKAQKFVQFIKLVTQTSF